MSGREIVPSPLNQEFSDSTLKGLLLANVDRTTQNETVLTLNKILIKRVDTFWEKIVIPLKSQKKFDGNKIKWYFSIYREGLEARKTITTPFLFLNVTSSDIEHVLAFYKNKTLAQYLDFGICFLSNTLSLLTNWSRDNLMIKRLEKIYTTDNPLQWITTAEAEEHGAMSDKGEFPEIFSIINNIQLIMSRRY
jgi:hypothetical protein